MTRIERTVLMLLLVGVGLQPPELVHVQEPRAATARDYGVGIISFAFSPALGVELPVADTLTVRQRTSAQSPVVARFLFFFEAPEAYSWSYALEADEVEIQSNALEFDYEVEGLPFDSVASGGEWTRVIYGMSARRMPYRGWVRAEAGRTRHRFWSLDDARGAEGEGGVDRAFSIWTSAAGPGCGTIR